MNRGLAAVLVALALPGVVSAAEQPAAKTANPAKNTATVRPAATQRAATVTRQPVAARTAADTSPETVAAVEGVAADIAAPNASAEKPTERIAPDGPAAPEPTPSAASPAASAASGGVVAMRSASAAPAVAVVPAQATPVSPVAASATSGGVVAMRSASAKSAVAVVPAQAAPLNPVAASASSSEAAAMPSASAAQGGAVAPAEPAHVPAAEKRAKMKNPFIPTVGGYVQPGFTWQPGTGGQAGAFNVRRARVKVFGKVLVPELGYAFMFDIAAAQKPLRDGYLWLGYVPGQQIKIGQFKLPFGWENPTSSTVLPTILRAQVSAKLAQGPDLRDIGVGIFGKEKLTDTLTLTDGFAVVNGAGANNTENTPKKDVYGQVGVAYGKLLHVGISASTVEFRDAAKVRRNSTRLGADVELASRYLFVVGEYLWANDNAPDDANPSGFYVTAVAHAPCAFEAVAKFERFDPDLPKSAVDQRLTFGLNYKLYGDRVKLMADYVLGIDQIRDDLLVQTQIVF